MNPQDSDNTAGYGNESTGPSQQHGKDENSLSDAVTRLGFEAGPGGTASPSVEGLARGRYLPIALHAKGGLGEVFLAEDTELHRQVALKQMQERRATDAESRRRFLLEAEITGNLEHPGIVPVYGLGVHADGRPYYAMRFIRGETLAQAISTFHAGGRPDFQSLAFRQLLRRFLDVCNAVAYAHSRGILHRDLKPSNVMLGAFGETLLVDWGLAKPFSQKEAATTPAQADVFVPCSADAALTTAGDVVGTAPFMSPEQARGQRDELGPASDVYSLGATLYVVLTGQPAFAGNMSQVLFAVVVGDFQPPRAVQPRIPRALEAVCLRAMACTPRERMSSALELAAELERWLADEPVPSYRDPLLERLRRWLRRHRLLVATAAVLVVTSVVALAIGYVLVARQRDVALAARAQAQRNAAASRKVVDDFLIRIGDDRFSEIPGFEIVRKEMVDLAIARYRELLKIQPDDPDVLRDVARAYQRSANLYRMMNQLPQARQLYDESIAILNELSKRQPDDLATQASLVALYLDLGDLLNRTDGPQIAEAKYREALPMAMAVAAHPDATVSQRTLAVRATMELGAALGQRGQFVEAIQRHEEAIEGYRRLLREAPHELTLRLALVFTENSLVAMARNARQLDKAAVALQSALEHVQDYLQQNAGNPNLRYLLAWARQEEGLLLRDQARPVEDVLTPWEEANQVLEKLCQEFPRVASFQRKHAELLTAQGQLLLAHDATAAAADARRAVELLQKLYEESGGAVYSSVHLATAHVVAAEAALRLDNKDEARKHAEEARQSVEKVRTNNPDSPVVAEILQTLAALMAKLRE